MLVCFMRTGIEITVSPASRCRLEAIAADRNTPQKHAWRARIVLLTANGFGTGAIMTATGKSKTCVWRWQERFMREGIACCATRAVRQAKRRSPAKPPIGSLP